MTSRLSRLTTAQREQAADALDLLADALGGARLRLPSLAVDWRLDRITGTVLVELGRAPAHVVVEMAALICEGLTARAHQQR